MPAPLSLLAAALLAAPAPHGDATAWAPVLEDRAVVVELDTTRVAGAGEGAVTAWLRWHFAERVASPQAWDSGVRWTLDYLQVDCVGGRVRTFSSMAYAANGALVEDASYDNPVAPWHVPAPDSVGEMVARSVCAAAPRDGR